MKKEKTKPTTIRIVQLNNKSRKGTYIYLKAKGKPSRYYKQQGIPIDIYKEHYEEKYVKKEKRLHIREYRKAIKDPTYKVSKETKGQIKKYLNQIKKRPSITKAIKKGITQVKIANALTATQTKVNKKVNTLLKDLVIDKKLLKLITTEENLKKIKQRFQYTLKIKNKSGETLATAEAFNQTPQKEIQTIQKKVKEGEQITEGEYDQAGDTTIQGKLETEGYTYQHKKKGKVSTIELTITFRKGK